MNNIDMIPDSIEEIDKIIKHFDNLLGQDRACHFCLHYDSEPGSGLGKCRKTPPRSGSKGYLSVWPTVLESDFCGQHKLNEARFERAREFLRRLRLAKDYFPNSVYDLLFKREWSEWPSFIVSNGSVAEIYHQIIKHRLDHDLSTLPIGLVCVKSGKVYYFKDLRDGIVRE